MTAEVFIDPDADGDLVAAQMVAWLGEHFDVEPKSIAALIALLRLNSPRPEAASAADCSMKGRLTA